MMVKANTTQSLVTKAQAGDRGAFDALMKSFEDRLREAIRHRMGQKVQGRLEPDDVLQETFLRAFESIASFQWRDRSIGSTARC